MSDPPPLPSERVQALGTAYDAIVSRAMGKRPEDRVRDRRGGRRRAARGGGRPADRRSAAEPRLAAALAGAARAAARGGGRSRRRHDARRALSSRRCASPSTSCLLVALLVAGVAFSAIAVAVPLALLVYAAGVVPRYRDPDTARRREPGDD